MKCKNCEINDAVKYSKYSTGEFCSKECARAYSTKGKRKDINKKVSDKMSKKYFNENYLKIEYLKEKNNEIFKKNGNSLNILICESCGEEFFSVKKNKNCSECNKIAKRKLIFKRLNLFDKNLKILKQKAINLLKEEYFEKELSVPEICKKYNLFRRSVWKFLNDNGIKLRDLSESNCLTFKKGRKVSSLNNNFNSGYLITWYGKKIFYRSSYEKRVMNVLDKNKIMYLYENKRVEYLYKNRIRIYISDFYFPEYNIIIETKNKYLQKRDKDKIISEIESVEKLGILFFLAGENEIKKIENNDFEYLERILKGKEFGVTLK